MNSADSLASDRIIAEISEVPDLSALKTELHAALADHDDITTRRMTARAIRHNEWAGQSDDNRKHAENMDEDPFPFEGAADTRCYLADTIINEKVALLTETFFRANLQATGIESGDIPRANRVTTLLRWLRNNHLLGELRREVELAAQYVMGDDPGLAIVGVYWMQETALRRHTLTLEELATHYLGDMSQLPPEEARRRQADALDLLHNPGREEQALQIVGTHYPLTPKRRLRPALADLRETGKCTLPQAYLRQNRPCIVTHRLNDDIFLPSGITDLQRAPVIFTREWITEVEARARITTHQWDEAFVDDLIEHGKGKSAIDTVRPPVEVASTDEADPMANHYEVWTAWTRAIDEIGCPAIYCTVFCDCCEDSYGKHELLTYDHGEMPFHLLTRERLNREITSSRGTTVVASSAQYEVKVQRDSRTDFTQLSILPPLKVNSRRGGIELILGPAAQIQVNRSDDVEALPLGSSPQTSIEIENAARRDLDDYFGRLTQTSVPSRSMLLQQAETNRWMDGWKGVFAHLLALCQQYLSPVEIARITGGEPEQITREEIAGRYDLALEFDVRYLDLEFTQQILRLIAEVLGMDAAGLVDRAKLVRFAMQMINPNLADLVVQPAEAATGREVEDEIGKIGGMAWGIEAPVKGDENPELRLRVLQNTIQQSPMLANRMGQREDVFPKLVQARMQAFQQQLNQRQNAQIGRTGYVPVLGGQQPASP